MFEELNELELLKIDGGNMWRIEADWRINLGSKPVVSKP